MLSIMASVLWFLNNLEKCFCLLICIEIKTLFTFLLDVVFPFIYFVSSMN